MSPSGYIIEVTNLSPNASEKDVMDFFSFCGAIEDVETVRSGGYTCGAYVTFRDPHALETSLLLSGAVIVDQYVCIRRYGQYEDDFNPWNRPWKTEESGSMYTMHADPFASTPGEAVTLAQEVVKTMVSKGYILSKDAYTKAKAFDESYKVSSIAAAKVAELSKIIGYRGYVLSKDAYNKARELDESYKVSAMAAAKVVDLSKRIGLTDNINAGVGAIKSVDDKYHIYDATKFVGRTAYSAATTIVNSSYFAKGALLVSDALTKAAKVAADLGNHDNNK